VTRIDYRPVNLADIYATVCIRVPRSGHGSSSLFYHSDALLIRAIKTRDSLSTAAAGVDSRDDNRRASRMNRFCSLLITHERLRGASRFTRRSLALFPFGGEEARAAISSARFGGRRNNLIRPENQPVLLRLVYRCTSRSRPRGSPQRPH